MSVEVPPAGASTPAGGGIPQKIFGIPLAVLVLGAGAVLVFLYLRSRTSTAGIGAIPSIITTSVGGVTGATKPTQPTTPGTPAQGSFSQASIIDAWVKAQTQLADLTDDVEKKKNRLGGSWVGIAKYLIMNPNVFSEAGNSIRYTFTQIPAGYYTWVVHISNLYDSAKAALVHETNQGYFTSMTLPQLVEVLRANPSFTTAHPEYHELLSLPITVATAPPQ